MRRRETNIGKSKHFFTVKLFKAIPKIPQLFKQGSSVAPVRYTVRLCFGVLQCSKTTVYATTHQPQPTARKAVYCHQQQAKTAFDVV